MISVICDTEFVCENHALLELIIIHLYTIRANNLYIMITWVLTMHITTSTRSVDINGSTIYSVKHGQCNSHAYSAYSFEFVQPYIFMFIKNVFTDKAQND